MDLNKLCPEMPKVELHAHLNGSLSRTTMLELQRCYADSGVSDTTNAFLDEFQIGAGDTRNLSDCFQVFDIAHSLTKTPETLSLATQLTLEEFQADGCCYIELRSTPRETPFMTSQQYIETIAETLRNNVHLPIKSRLIVSINRNSSIKEAESIAELAIKCFKEYPDTIVGIELSGNPSVGRFQDFVPALTIARFAGLKITLHCGEVCNPSEVLEMLQFKPDRIGHGVCIHPDFGGTEETWQALCKSQIPVEICLTSNVNTKSTPDYNSHHFKELYNANVPVIICTDDKGVFCTSLSQEYRICADVFGLQPPQLAKLALNAVNYVFAEEEHRKMTDLSDFSTGKAGDSELQDFLLAEKQKAQFHAQIHEFNDFCWDKCVDKPSAKLDSKTETCITNCVERFIDVSLLITNRFAQMLEKGGGMQ